MAAWAGGGPARPPGRRAQVALSVLMTTATTIGATLPGDMQTGGAHQGAGWSMEQWMGFLE